MDIPVIPEFVQYGVVGIAIVSMLVTCYVTRLFIGAFIQFVNQMISLNDTISKLTAKIDALEFRRHRRDKEEQ